MSSQKPYYYDCCLVLFLFVCFFHIEKQAWDKTKKDLDLLIDWATKVRNIMDDDEQHENQAATGISLLLRHISRLL